MIEKLKDFGDTVIAGGDEYNRHVLSELAKAGRLKGIARFWCRSLTKLDLEAASEFGIAVTNTAANDIHTGSGTDDDSDSSTARSIAFCDRALREDGLVYRTCERQPRWKKR